VSYKLAEIPSDAATERELRKVEVAFGLGQARRLLVAAVAPTKPFEGMVLICNGTTFNPIGDGIKRPIWYDGAAWQKFS